LGNFINVSPLLRFDFLGCDWVNGLIGCECDGFRTTWNSSKPLVKVRRQVKTTTKPVFANVMSTVKGLNSLLKNSLLGGATL
jgi:hypothetical protein